MIAALAIHTPTPEEDATWAELYAEAQAREERASLATLTSLPDDCAGRIAWSPQAGSRVNFMRCPLFEVLLHGTRGGGKSDALLMSFAQHVGQGHGPAWRGVIFRQTYPQLADIVAKSERWFRLIFPEARFNRASHTWTWPSGEALLFRHMARPSDYWLYHGAELPYNHAGRLPPRRTARRRRTAPRQRQLPPPFDTRRPAPRAGRRD